MKLLKFLLVDDEPIIRKGILSSINWEAEGFYPVGEGANGIEAIEKIEQLEPDIVITDIKMPFMDGLELCKAINERWPNIRILILSGYDDFEYAREAIQYKVSNFILKPVGAEELVGVMSDLGRDIRNKQSIEEQKERRLELISTNLPLIQRELLLSLCGLIPSPKDILDKEHITYLKLDISGPMYQIYLVEFNLEVGEIYEPDIILDLFNTFFSANGEHCAAVHKSDNVFILLRSRSEGDMAAIPFCERLQASYLEELTNKPTIGVGSSVNSIDTIKNSYHEAEVALSYRIYGELGAIIPFSTKERLFEKKNCTESPEKLMLKLINSIKSLDVDVIYEHIDTLFISIGSHELSETKIKRVLISFFNILIQISRDNKIDIIKCFPKGFDPYESVDTLSTLKQWKNLLEDIVKQYIETVELLNNSSFSKVTRNAIEYVETHFSESISLSGAADYLKISPNYLSKIFKDETGENFVPFVNRIRVEAAADLLTDTDKMIYEITSEVGFKDYKYFASQFRKYKGISPREFRKKIL